MGVALAPALLGQAQNAAAGSAPPSSSAATAGSLAWRTERAARAADFVDSVGVQTHAPYPDTAYAQWPRVLEEVKALGVRHIRDGLPSNPELIAKHQALAAAGIGCTCGFVVDPTLSAEQIVRTARQARDVEALEAPNECDAGTNCGGGGEAGIRHAVEFLPVLRTAARRLNVPLIGPSFTRGESYEASGALVGLVDDANLHVYFGDHAPGSEGWGAGDPQGHRYGSIAWWKDQAAFHGPALPQVITETGYMAPKTAANVGSIPEEVEAAYTPRTLLLAFQQGIRRTFLYELVDEFPTTGYGLLRHDFSEKPAFTAVKHLLALLQDGQERPRTRPPAELQLALQGGGETLRHVLLQKTNGRMELIVWLEESAYDGATGQTRSVTPKPVTIAVRGGATVRRVVRFGADGNTATQAMEDRRAAMTVTIGDQLTVLEIAPR